MARDVWRIRHNIHANGLTHAVFDAGEQHAPVALLLHGFPDSHSLWEPMVPQLIDAGYRVIAPDMRGFGETDMASNKAAYEIMSGAVPDMLEIMGKLNISSTHLVGHDFGAPVAWALAANYPDTFVSLTALSVGHSRAFVEAGADQKRKSWYILLHQLRGLCEATYKFSNWRFPRSHWAAHPDIEGAIALLSRPGRLTAGIDWYRANISLSRIISPPPSGTNGEEIVRIPTLGVWSDGDKYLVESQMTASEQFVDAPWRYARIDGASHWIPADAPNELAHMLIDHWRQAATN